MKTIIVLVCTMFIGCCTPRVVEVVKVVHDTIEVPQDVELINKLKADVVVWKDSVDYLNSTIPLDVYMNARKIEKIKYYIDITERNSNNKKFFYGWIRRTIAD